MKMLDMVALVLLLVGGLNWGLVGFFNFDAVAHFLGSTSMATHIVYCAVGICALYEAYKHLQSRRATTS